MSYKKPDKKTLKKMLSPLQYRVTQWDLTEKPFKNEYWDSQEEGIYVDIVSGEPLFSSLDKYDSGTGWPSFTGTIADGGLKHKKDYRIPWRWRMEVRSPKGDSHLGHVFEDGPQPSGQRFCINSAALRFVPVSELEKQGYGQYLELFKKS